MIANTFTDLSNAYRRMSLEGCTEDQRNQADRMARAAREIATTARRSGMSLERLESEPELAVMQDAMELQEQLRRFDMRRSVLRRELENMTGAAGKAGP